MNGQPLISHQFQRFESAGGKEACIVLAEGDDTYFPFLPEWVTPLRNPEPDRGQFSSFQIGAKFLLDRPTTLAAFVLPVDIPAAQEECWRRLSLALTEGICAALPTHQDRGGHPLLLKRDFLEALILLPPTARLDHALHALNKSQVARVPACDPTVLANWNTPTSTL